MIDLMNPTVGAIDWQNNASYLLVNPSHELEKPDTYYPAHIVISTSGYDEKKWIFLSKEAFLISASFVNSLFTITSADKWGIALPLFHVGGLSILARAHLSNSPVRLYKQKWDPFHFHEFLESEKITLTSLVPTQLYDLCCKNINPPGSLRAVIVGGALLDESLKARALELKWPIYPTYGLTECASQAATALIPGGPLVPLPHVEFRVNETLEIKSPSLLTGYVYRGQFFDPKIDGWFKTSDIAILNPELKIKGRISDEIKISGEMISLGELERILNKIKWERGIILESCFVPVKDSRSGFKIHLFANKPEVDTLIALYNLLAHPLARIEKAHVIDKLPLNAVGKIDRHKLQMMVK